MKRVFICSKYRGDTENNTKYAKAMCINAIELGHAPIAPHLFYTQFLDDDHPSHRQNGISAGMAFLEACDEVWVCLNGQEPSEGMIAEIKLANTINKPVIYYDVILSDD